MVRYEGRIYPRVVIGAEGDDVEIKCMSATGMNRFYWPFRDDRCWYSSRNVTVCIPEETEGWQPTHSGKSRKTSRHAEKTLNLVNTASAKLV